MPWTSKPPLEGRVQYGAKPKTSCGRSGGAAATLAGAPVGGVVAAGRWPACLPCPKKPAASGRSTLPCWPERRAWSCDQRAEVSREPTVSAAPPWRANQPMAMVKTSAVQSVPRLTTRTARPRNQWRRRRCRARERPCLAVLVRGASDEASGSAGGGGDGWSGRLVVDVVHGAQSTADGRIGMGGSAAV